MKLKENNIAFYDGEDKFYKEIKRKLITDNFKEFLNNFLKHFNFVQVERAKKIYYEDGSLAIWDIKLPNPGIRGKNAFRMLCVGDKRKKKMIPVRLFNRDQLGFKGQKRGKGTTIYNELVKELKGKYFKS